MRDYYEYDRRGRGRRGQGQHNPDTLDWAEPIELSEYIKGAPDLKEEP